MSQHELTSRAESPHRDQMQPLMSTKPMWCYPGVRIDVTYHPGHEAEAAAALDAAYADVRAQIVKPKEPKP